MARPLKNDKSHRPIEKKCIYCNTPVLKGASLGYKKAFCSKEHMVFYMKESAFFFFCTVCDKKVLTQPTQMKYRNRKTCSIKCRGVFRHQEALKRRKEYSKHQLDRLARYSPEAEEWRKSVFARDDYTCQVCGVRGTYIEADHIKPFAYFPELRYELTNGRTLCRTCHNKTKIGYKKMREIWLAPTASLKEN